MDWTNDLETPSKKTSKGIIGEKKYLQQLIPRLGRRGGQSAVQNERKFDDDALEGTETISMRTDAPMPPPRTRKTGWGDELKSAKVRSANLESERMNRRSRDEADDDIPVIPDIDEIQEDQTPDVANAPSVGINRVAAYKELDTDLLKNAAFAFLEDINLSLLTEKLYPEKLVKEPDEVWNWDHLFTQVSSELNSEAQKKS